MGLQWLYGGHVEQWRKGNPHFRVLEQHFQSSPEKRATVFDFFREWVEEQRLQPIEATYAMRSVRASEPLQVTLSGDEDAEAFFRRQYARPDLSAKHAGKLKEKLNKTPEIVVFIAVGKSRPCSECGAEIEPGTFSAVERGQPLCMRCADLDHLLFLPSGDATLTRRAKKLSSLSAVVVKFSRTRKRYERQGLLVTEAALDEAEAQCDADADERSVQRQRAARLRDIADEQLVAEMAAAICEQFPRCPADEAQRIAAHTAIRGSGRVGRSAAGRQLDSKAIQLAVIAHIRHEYTDYDELLMQGIERSDAREMIRAAVEKQLDRWRG
jgi:hypothetical protein